MGTQRRSMPGIDRGDRSAARRRDRPRAVLARLVQRRPQADRPRQAGRGARGLDYALWQGPAPERAYRDNLVHYNWHWFWHWGTGELGNNGIHTLDLCRWGLGVDYPRRVTAGGGKYFFDDDQETPDTHVVTFDFGDKAITWEGRNWHRHGFEGSMFGIAFYGDKGSLVIDGNNYKIYDPAGKQTRRSRPKASTDTTRTCKNFLACVRSGGRLNCRDRGRAQEHAACATWAISPIAPATRSTSTRPTATCKTIRRPRPCGAASIVPVGNRRCKVVVRDQWSGISMSNSVLPYY